jgi:hypothetical protein
MRLKSPYRPKHYKDGGAVPLEAKVVDSEPMDKTVASIDVDHGDDTASSAFKGQIDALRKAEDTQRQRAADLTTEQKYAHHVREVSEHIRSHPDMVKNPEVLAAAADEVGRDTSHGLAVHSMPFFDLVKANFEKRLAAQAPEQNQEPDEPVRPRRTRGGADDGESSEDDRARARRLGYSASGYISRDPIGGTIALGTRYGDSPGRVTLSAEEKDLCRRTGQSEKDYAMGKLQLREDKANGRYDR